ncbi:hypothetical protein, partial [Halalkalibacter lacteus]|uniref:hypothetical protein n=1 Tax=Halalkalibacter lacteus TaxID=3090663 RepID=UPI002FCB8DB4
GPLEKAAEVGPVESATVNDVARLVAEEAAIATGREPVGITHLPMRPGEVPNAVVRSNVSTLEPLGIDANGFVSLEEGVKRTVI